MSRVTIVVVPRERWSFAERSLASIHAHTARPYELVYVSAGTPEPVRSAIAAAVRRHGDRMVSSDEILTPNQTRNLGARHVTTEYTVFIDNDVIVEPGWLERLVRCADETGGWIVGPLYCIGWPAGQRIHMAGGVAHITEDGGRRHMHDEHIHIDELRAQVAPSLRLSPSEQVEFHCMLVRTEALAKLGPLDEELLSLAEHLDVCMLARAAGGGVWFEPAAVVTYVPMKLLRAIDVPLFRRRWSNDWNRRSIERFGAKWRLAADDPWRQQQLEWGAMHRCEAQTRSKVLRVLLGPRRGYAISRRLDKILERFDGGLVNGLLGR
jgi:GT2 family glycosyltransferase